MAYAAVVHVMQLLEEELIQFPCRVLEIEEEKARYFHLKTRMVLNRLNELNILKDDPYSYVAALKEELESLARPSNKDLKEAARSPQVLADSRQILARIPDTLYQIHAISSSLEALVRKLDGQVTHHPSASLSRQWELADDLLSANEKFRKVIAFFNRVALEAISVYEKIDALLRKLNDSDYLQAVNLIKSAADEAADAIEDFLTSDPFLLEREDSKKNIFYLLLEMKDSDKNTFDLLKKIGQLLSNSLEKVSSIQQKNGDDIAESSHRSQGVEKDEDIGFRVSQLSVSKLDSSWESSDEQQNILLGIDDKIKEIVDAVTGPSSRLAVVTMKGAGGLRKTSLAQKVFHDLRIVYHFHTRAWLNCESNTHQVLSNLLQSVAPSYDESDDDTRDLLRRFLMDKYMSIEDKGDLLRRSLMGKRYLIVVDRLCNFEAWDVIGRYLPPDYLGSCILLTSVLGDESALDVSLEDYMVGRYDCMKDIIKELTRPPSALTTVTITGMGGIGKTTLAKHVSNHPNIVHHFHPLVWVNSVSSVDQLLSQLLHTTVQYGDEFHGQSNEDKGESLHKRLRSKRYLIVVDDLWNFQAWNAIERYLPDDKVGSRILITSRFMAFRTNIPKNSPHCIGPLDENQSWELLAMLVFGEEESCPSELEVIGKQIAERCGRLPLAISVLASTLSSIPRSYSSWSSVMESVNSSIVSVKPEECLDILAFSYNYLPHHLKPCFLFIAAFPAHREIEVQKLINLWIAAGLILDSKPSKPSEKVAEDYLEDLIRRSLVSVGKRSFDGRMRTCLIHDLVRQLCLREAQKENFLHVLEEAHSNAQVLEKQRHLIFNSDSFDDFQWLPQLPHLRSFTWLNLASDFRRGMVLLQLIGFKWLRVLDMYLLPFDTLPVQILSLVNLRYLGLSATDVLDASISQLWKLQTLIVYGTWMTRGEGNLTMLLEIWKMPWLREVNISTPTYLRYPCLLRPLPDGSCIPSSLQTLSTITFFSCTRQVLSLMPNLKKLVVHETKEDYENGESTHCFQNLASLIGLEILKCFFYKGHGKARTLDWNVFPSNLKKLTLNGSCLPWDEMKLLARLPKLETLKLKNNAFQGSGWVITEEDQVVFPCLKQLLIDDTDLAYWEVEDTEIFPSLENLALKSCESLEKIPAGIGEITVLQLIELHYCSKSVENSAREFEEQYGNPKIFTRSDSDIKPVAEN